MHTHTHPHTHTRTHTQGVSREDFIAGVARDIQSKIPEGFDLPLLKKEIGIPSPTQVVLLQELERWNNVLTVGPGLVWQLLLAQLFLW